ncbi:MAG: winged helix-turn-helix domain-containing protein [Candidatus Nanoarchaeia archaeon]|nr:winged helix-turn-helix domain-containing protein [Candidatus Nanoarchaeia archaeon]
MENISGTEMQFVLTVLKSPEQEYNANSISKELNISPMGALKIARKLEKEGIIKLKEMGRARFYSISFESQYVKQYLRFLLMKEAEEAPPYIKMWIREIRKVKNAEIAVIFGSVLQKQDKANDVDVLLATGQKKFADLKKEVEAINKVNTKKVHSIYTTLDILGISFKNHEKAVLDAVKGVVVIGEDNFLELLSR